MERILCKGCGRDITYVDDSYATNDYRLTLGSTAKIYHDDTTLARPIKIWHHFCNRKCLTLWDTNDRANALLPDKPSAP